MLSTTTTGERSAGHWGQDGARKKPARSFWSARELGVVVMRVETVISGVNKKQGCDKQDGGQGEKIEGGLGGQKVRRERG